MAVHVTLFPTLRNLSKSKQESYELDWREGLTPMAILTEEGFIERDAEAVLAVVNDEQATLETALADGDRVELRVNIQGGASGEPRMLRAAPQFRVADLVRTAEHYRDVLGFALDDYFGEPPLFTQARRGEVAIQLGQAADENAVTRSHGPIGYNAYVWIDDVDALAGEYRASGADVAAGPVDRVYACRELVVRDCNGLTICFGQELSGG